MPCYRPVLKHPECERVSAFATRNSLIAEARALSHHAAIGKSVRRKSHMETSTRKAIAPRSAATGSVVTQADKIAAIIRRRPWRVTVPIPKRAPQETWVVETGIPKRLAPMTIALVTRLATNPWPWFIGVILWLITSATRRALKTPPRAIGRATTSALPTLPKSGATSRSAAIFGVSFNPRAKLTAPAERSCAQSREADASMRSRPDEKYYG